MKKQQSIFRKRELVLAVSVAMFSGVMTGCSSGGDGGEAAATPGAYTINTKGGDANAINGDVNGGYGGNGGEVSASIEGGTGGVVISATGKADTTFRSPIPAVNSDTGSNPLDVTADTTVEVATLWSTPIADGASIVANTSYIGTDGVLRIAASTIVAYATDAEVSDDSYYTDGNELYVASANTGADLATAGTPYTQNSTGILDIYGADGDANTADTPYTGISVASGATLTMGLNDGGTARISVSNDIENNGTITTVDNGTRRGYLTLNAYNYIASGVIDTSGNSTAFHGGYIEIYTAYSIINSGALNSNGNLDSLDNGGNGGSVRLDSNGFIQNSGDINAYGADSTSSYGGTGRSAYMYAAYIENSGNINTNAGDSISTLSGKSPGQVRLNSELGLNNSGNISATGGNGSNGGSQGYVWLATNAMGTTRNSGNIITNSGDGLTGYAGYNNSISLRASGGDVINSGDISAAGGSGVTSTSSSYGRGGSIEFRTDSGDGGTAPGNIIVSGNLDTSAGDLSAAAAASGRGGYGGSISMRINMNEGNHPVSDQGISLLGYTDINTNGGNGYNAGRGGNVELYTYETMDAASFEYKTGPVINEANISTRGGDAIVSTSTTLAYGDYGGNVYMETADQYAFNNSETKVSNSGDIDTSGGNSYNMTSSYYSHSGYISLFGFHGVDNSGAITANGGNDTATDGGTNGRGGYAQSVNIDAEMGSIVNSGNISNNGGNGEYYGGYSNGVSMYGMTVKNSGDLSSNGGNADATLRASYGGNAGDSTLWGLDGFNAVSNSGALSYSGGTGVTEGADGCVIVGMTVVGNCNGGEER